MCGLAGYFDFKGVSDNILSDMCFSLHHRGPDSRDIWRDDNIGLVHTRLSILDLTSNGSQPMKSSSGRYVIIFNGEIYNHKKLRQTNQFQNYQWNSDTDTETILELIEHYGISKTLNEIEGMFAFALWDKKKKSLTLARDPLGQKPLYYGWINGKFLFASELKAIRAINELDFQIDRESLSIFVKVGFIPSPLTIYKGIKKLEPGKYCQLKPYLKNEIDYYTYYSLKDQIDETNKIKNTITDSEYKNKLRNVLTSSVKKQQISDVPIGAFLSGGIDSSLITALMQETNDKQIDTFTIGFENTNYDESTHAREISRVIGTRYHEIIVNYKSIQDIIPLIPTIYDEPFSDSSQLVTYLISKFAREKVTVSLSGDGGDELFGGYNRYLWANKILYTPLFLRKKISHLISMFNYSSLDKIQSYLMKNKNTNSRFSQLSNKMQKLSFLLLSKDFQDLYQNTLQNFSYNNRKNPEVINFDNNFDFTNIDKPTKTMNSAELMMYLDMMIYLPDDILCKVDRASMAVSLESRMPFLEKEVINFSLNLPINQKIRNGKTKWILRELLKDYIPKKLIDRPKTGFSIPLADWLRGPLNDYANDMLLKAKNNKEKFFNPNLIDVRWEEHKLGKKNWYFFLWNIIVFQSWFENTKYISIKK